LPLRAGSIGPVWIFESIATVNAGSILSIYLVLLGLQAIAALGLDALNIRFVRQHLPAMPEFLRGRVDNETYSKAGQYTLAKQRLAMAGTIVESVWLLAFIWAGFFGSLDRLVSALPAGAYVRGVLYIWIVAFLFMLQALPFDLYAVFVIEERFGFNKTTWKTWLTDLARNLIVGALLSIPLLLGVFWFVDRTGAAWWLYAFGFFAGFQLLLVWAYPLVIAPLFNKFSPLAEGDLRRAIMSLADRAAFRIAGVYVMDGSKRSAHGNAYFTGLGRNKRIVLFDTLLAQLNVDQSVAVLAHEIGHQLRRHVWRLLGLVLLGVLFGFWCLSRLIDYPPFFAAFGFEHAGTYQALTIFAFASAPVTFFLSPLLAAVSRRYEYEADRFAAAMTGRPETLADALWELSKHNLINFAPHPWYSFFHYSHPTLAERVAALVPEKPGAAPQGEQARAAPKRR
jgi:STE24 endopeptidase